jgi:hypothetical protein
MQFRVPTPRFITQQHPGQLTGEPDHSAESDGQSGEQQNHVPLHQRRPATPTHYRLTAP